MSEIVLSKDADTLICVLYKAYLERRESGVDKEQARFFDSSETIHTEFMPKWSFGDVDATCKELSSAKYFAYHPSDNIVYANAKLTDDGVTYMENRFKNKIKNVWAYAKDVLGVAI